MVNPTGYTALDLIGFTDKGTYSSSDNYVKNDLVHYSGNIWRCLIDDTTGITPAEGVNWTLFIGEPTNLVERIIAPIETDPATNAWAVGREIIYNNNLYEVIAAITAGDALVAYEDDPTDANIKLADPVETQLLNLKGNVSNRNLLDNAWFTVNQRGQSSYTGNGNYSVDRWIVAATQTVTINNDGSISISPSSATCQFTQRTGLSDEIANKTVTISIKFTDGSIESKTGIASKSNALAKVLADGTSQLILYYHPSRLDFEFIIQTNSGTNLNNIQAVKFEIGSISTLAMDTVPNYADELLKCQRYFIRYNSTSDCGVGFEGAGVNANINMFLPCAMRALPSLTYNASPRISGAGHAAANGIVVTSLSAVSITNNVLRVDAAVASGFTQGYACTLHLRDGAYIDLSADL